MKVHGNAQRIAGLTVEGHAGYADKGEDIVCAGVSALAETAVIGLRQVAGVKPAVTRQDGYLDLRLPAGTPEPTAAAAQTVLQTIIAGLRDLARSYPEYVEFEA